MGNSGSLTEGQCLWMRFNDVLLSKRGASSAGPRGSHVLSLYNQSTISMQYPSGYELEGRTEEGNRFPAVEETVIVRESDDHDRADDDLAVDDDRAVLDRVHAWKMASAPPDAIRGAIRSRGEGRKAPRPELPTEPTR